MREEVVRLERVTQKQDNVTFLDGVSLHIFRGEVMGLLCINAHGQEALVSLLLQNVPLHYGYVYIGDELVNSHKHSGMGRNPVSVIEERSRLVDALKVTDNIFVMRESFGKYVINDRILRTQLMQSLGDLDIGFDPGDPVEKLSSFDRCAVELLKAVVTGVKLIILRDITNFLSAADLIKFHTLIRRYSKEGVSFLYICNHHEEIFTISNRVSILEDGRIRRVLDQTQMRSENITPYIPDHFFKPSPPREREEPRTVLRLQDIYTEHIRGLSFHVAYGECVVLLDMNNTIFPDIAKLMNGKMPPHRGEVFLGDEIFNIRSHAAEVAFIRDNPTKTMLFYDLSYMDNLCFLLDKKVRRRYRREKQIQRSVLREYAPLVGDAIYSDNIADLPSAALYDLVYYTVHLLGPKIVFCVQPFSGADMYLRQRLIQLFEKLRERGVAVVILAVSVSDSLQVADRLLIIREGRLASEHHRDEFKFLKDSDMGFYTEAD